MKARSQLAIFAHAFSSEDVSILFVAQEVFRILTSLCEVDDLFLYPVHTNGSRDELIDLAIVDAEYIAKLILDTERNEITQHEGEPKPTINYKRVNGGFSFNAKYLLGDETAFYINIGKGFSVDGVSISGFNRSIEFSYSWYKTLLYKIVECFNPFFATVKLSNQQSNVFYNQMNIKYPIGWITYFSDSYEFCIPEDLEGVDYDLLEGGKYLCSSNIDFMKDKAAYYSNQAKLERIINEIKERIPGFIKQEVNS